MAGKAAEVAGAVLGLVLFAQASAAAPQVKILHSPIVEAEREAELVIRCVIVAPNEVYLPTLYYRNEGERQYTAVPMVPLEEAGLFAGALPALFVKKNLEYYIEARDVKDPFSTAMAASPERPFRVRAAEKKAKVSRAAIHSDPPGAELAIDGQSVGSTPFLCDLPPGEHTVVLSKAGYRTAQATVQLPEGRDVELRYPLAKTAEPAVLAVLSDPPGARVFLDGNERGKTPLIEQAPTGTHELRLELPGYQTIAREMHFVANRNAEVSVTLQKLPPEPVIAVSSEPPGAILSIDGTDLGRTPVLSVLGPGEHELVLRKDAFRSIGAQIIMPKDRDLDLRYTLEPVPPTPIPPRIAVSSDPPGADIFIDGAKVGGTPFLQELPPGEHKIKLVHEGFVPYERAVVMPRDRDIEVTLALIPLPPPPGPSKIEISADPPEANLFLDGKGIGKGTARGMRSPGDYVVEARLPGYRSVSQRITVVQGQSVNLKLALNPMPKEAAAPWLSIASDPNGAQLHIDGKPVGKTPYQGETTSGDHVIALSLPEHKRREEKFRIPAAKDFELRVNWTLSPARKKVSVASASKKATPPPPPDAEEAKRSSGGASAATLPAVKNLLAAQCPDTSCPPPATVTQIQKVWYRAGAIPWIATAVGAATIGVGAYYSVQSARLAAFISTAKAQNRTLDASVLSEFTRTHRTSLILYGVGGGLAATVDVYWLLSSVFSGDPPPETRTSAPPSVEVPKDEPARSVSTSDGPPAEPSGAQAQKTVPEGGSRRSEADTE